MACPHAYSTSRLDVACQRVGASPGGFRPTAAALGSPGGPTIAPSVRPSASSVLTSSCRSTQKTAATARAAARREGAPAVAQAVSRHPPSPDSATISPEENPPRGNSDKTVLPRRSRASRRNSSADALGDCDEGAEHGDADGRSSRKGPPRERERGRKRVAIAEPSEAESLWANASDTPARRRSPSSLIESPQPDASATDVPATEQQRWRRARAPTHAALDSEGRASARDGHADGGGASTAALTERPATEQRRRRVQALTQAAPDGERRARTLEGHADGGGAGPSDGLSSSSSSSSNSIGGSGASSSGRPGDAGGGPLGDWPGSLRVSPRRDVSPIRASNAGAPGRRGQGNAGSSGGGGGASAGYSRTPNAWRVTYTLQGLPPDLPSLAAAARVGAASWHPLHISGALNHTVKLRDGLSRSGRFRGGAGSGAPAMTTSGADTRPQHDAPVRELLDLLYGALMPHIPAMLKARYAVNALWVCAKTDYWGAPGDGFVDALLARLRADDYALLREPSGQAHSNLWWALSQLPPESGKQAEVEAEAATSSSLGSSRRSSGGGGREPGPVGVEPVDGGGGGGGRGGGVGGGCRDLLEASAAVIKAQRTLDAQSFTPQGLCNMLLAAARLQYGDDPAFTERLLGALVEHPGPLVPQDISNAVYALGELYGTDDDDDHDDDGRTATAGGAGGDDAEGAARRAGDDGDAPGSLKLLPPSLASHVRELAAAALRVGLHRFNPQALSNTTYALARLGVRLAGGRGTNSLLNVAPQSPAGPREDELQPQQSRHHRPPPPQQQQQRWESPRRQQQQQRDLPDDPDAALRLFAALLAEHMRDRLQHDPRSFNEQDLGNATWALARVGYLEQSYYTAAVHAATVGRCMEHATSHNWAMFLWALIEVGHKPPPLLLGQLLRRNVCDGEDRDGDGGGPNRYGWDRDVLAWCTLPWAMAGVGVQEDEVLRRVGAFARAAEGGCRRLKPAWLSRGLWALAVMPEGALVHHRELAAALAGAANQHEAHEYGEPNLTQLWQVHLEVEATFNGQPRTVTITPNHLPDAPEATATARGAPRAALSHRGSKRGTEAAGPDAGLPPTAAASAGHGDAAVAPLRLHPGLVLAARETMLRVSSRLSADAATTFQHAVFSCLCSLMTDPAAGPTQSQPEEQQQEQHHRGPPRVLRKARGAAGADSDDSEGGADGPAVAESDGEVSVLQPRLRRVARASSRRQLAADAASGSSGGGISCSVSSGGPVSVVRVEPEWLVEALAVRVDVCVWLSDGRVLAVEADGPWHFYTNQPRVKRPYTALRNRQLGRVFGPEGVRCVPYWKWDALAELQARRAYLVQLLGL